MRKLALLLTLTLGLQTSAQPIDVAQGKFRNITATGIGKFAVVDAGVLNVQGQETVAGKVIDLSTAGPAYTSNVNSGQYILFDATANGGIVSGANTLGFQVAGTSAYTIGSGSIHELKVYPVFADLGYLDGLSAGTAGSGTGITAGTTSAIVDHSHKLTVINTALTAAATTDITIWTTPANTRVKRIVAEVTQVFTGGALSAMTLTCGSAAGGTQYLLSNSVFTAQNTWGDAAAEIGAGLLSATVADMGTPAAGIPGAIAISCRFTCTGANCNAATQGSVSFYIDLLTYR